MVVPFVDDDGDIGSIEEKIKGVGRSVYSEEAPCAWFVAYDGTTNELADELQFGDDPETGEGIIVLVTTYQGFASESLWEWMENYRGK